MIQTLSSTTNFVIKYDDTFINAKRRAEQLQSTCESDFDVLRSWFGISDGFGSSNRVTLQIEHATLAYNNGYHSDGASFIHIDPLDSHPVQEQADDGVQALFVAEMIEVLMDLRNIRAHSASWHPNKSDGEGLSRVAAASLHPLGYYKALNAPFVNSWLKLKRDDDWVSRNEDDDDNIYSFGCAILFIYYMRDQLQHSLGDIIRHGGDTLEETYRNLTGSTGGFAAFKELLDRYLPYEAGNPGRQMRDLASDNPFPIREGNDRRVGLGFAEDTVEVGGRIDVVRQPSTVTVKPFFTCPEATYRYYDRQLNSKLRCIASTDGFAQPEFSWRVNGQRAATGGSILPTVPITTDQANNPGVPVNGSGAAHIQWSEKSSTSTFEEVSGELTLSNAEGNHLGHEHLTIEVTVREAFGATDEITITGFATLDTRDIRYEEQYYRDRARCAAAFHRQIDRYNLQDIPLVFRIPEPDPPPGWMEALRGLRGVATELERVRNVDDDLGSRLADELGRVLEVPPRLFPLLAHTPEG